MMRGSNTATLLFVGLFLCAPLVCAQQGGSGGNPPPPPEEESSSQAEPVSPYDQALEPQPPPEDESSPISGIGQPRLGGLRLGKSFLVPSLNVQETFDTNIQDAGAATARTRDSVTNLSGGLNLQWMAKRSSLSLGYVGSTLLYNTTSQSRQYLQGMNVSESFQLRRWTLVIGDSFSYIPPSLSGLGGYGLNSASQANLPWGNFGVGTVSPSFNPLFLPGQNIQGTGREIANTTLGQATYIVGPRSSLSLSTSYGLVHFVDSGFIDSRSIAVSTGYTLRLNARNDVGFSYAASLFSFSNSSNSFGTHTVYFTYRRRISGRMIASVQGGPQVATNSGLPGKAGAGAAASNQVSWSVSSSLSYLSPHGSISGSYSRSANEGSGLLLGSQSNNVQLSLGRQVGRMWSGSVSGGYSRNDALTQVVTGTSSALRFTGWQAALGLARPLGRYLHLQLQYSASRQTSNSTGCPIAASCGIVALRQTVGVGFSWSYRPIALE